MFLHPVKSQTTGSEPVINWSGCPVQAPVDPVVEPHTVTRESGFFVDGRIVGIRYEWMIDTGCSRTIIAGRIFDKLSEDSRPELQVYDETLLSADECMERQS